MELEPNMKFGQLTVVRRAPERDRIRFVNVAQNGSTRIKRVVEKMWECTCSCGNTTYALKSSLTSHKTKSCGCLQKTRLIERNITHNLSKSRLYGIYGSMLTRCYNTSRSSYHRYGARGIYVCDEWLTAGTGFMAFYSWAMSNGYRDPAPGEPKKDWLTLERIDNDGPYAPWNCRWIPKSDQSNNRVTSRYIFDGAETLTWKDFEHKYSLSEGWVKVRKVYGWCDSAIVFAAENQSMGITKLHSNIARKRGFTETVYVDKRGAFVLIPALPEINP